MSVRNKFDSAYTSIKSYDAISQYYCDKLFPYLNEFERKLKKIMLNIYIINFNEQYYLATTNKDFQDTIKGNIKKQKLVDKNKLTEEDIIKNAFYSLDYNEINNLLFTPTVLEEDKIYVNNKLNEIKDLSTLPDKEIRKLIDKYKPKTDWKRLFGNKKLGKDFQSTFDSIRLFRNSIAHCKFINKSEYTTCFKLLQNINIALDEAIKITETQDFINKNYELSQKSMERIYETIGTFTKSLAKSMVPITEMISQAIEPTREISRKLAELVQTSSFVNAMDSARTVMSKYDLTANELKDILKDKESR